MAQLFSVREVINHAICQVKVYIITILPSYYQNKMAFYNNSIFTIENLMDDSLEGNAPRVFSFLGVIDDHTMEQQDLQHPDRLVFNLIMHLGTKARLRLVYIAGSDLYNEYDDRILDDNHCIYYPKGSLLFLPRLDVLYVEGDTLFCQFLGGNERKGFMNARQLPNELPKQPAEKIGENRVMLLLDINPSSIEEFLQKQKVIYFVLFTSII